MHHYRSGLVGLALAVIVAIVPPNAAHAQQATPSDAAALAAEKAAQAARFSAPLAVADFAGTWWRHGFSVKLQPDGSGTVTWRTYDDTPAQPAGRAQIQIDRVELRSASGTISRTTDPKTLPNGPFMLTEYDYGIGELSSAALGVGVNTDDGGRATTLCGPRYKEAPAWLTHLSPCGA